MKKMCDNCPYNSNEYCSLNDSYIDDMKSSSCCNVDYDYEELENEEIWI